MNIALSKVSILINYVRDKLYGVLLRLVIDYRVVHFDRLLPGLRVPVLTLRHSLTSLFSLRSLLLGTVLLINPHGIITW